jgi:hypothetical protein
MIRLGFGVRLSRHVYLGASVPLSHARRLAAHQGHGSPLSGLIGLLFIYALIRGALSAGN